MIKIVEAAFTGYPVTDIARARGFYEGVLGLAPALAHGPDEAAWIEYEIGPATLAISNISPEWKPSGNGPAIALEVEDFEEAIRHLRDRRVPFVLEPFPTPVCRMAVVSDPDGNHLTIHRRH